MFIVANRIPVAAKWHDEFENRFRKRAGEIDKQAGFVSMQILKPVGDDTLYIVQTTWQDSPIRLNFLRSWAMRNITKVSFSIT